MDELVVEVSFFYQPPEGEVMEHQHLVLVPPFDHGRHEYLLFCTLPSLSSSCGTFDEEGGLITYTSSSSFWA